MWTSHRLCYKMQNVVGLTTKKNLTNVDMTMFGEGWRKIKKDVENHHFML